MILLRSDKTTLTALLLGLAGCGGSTASSGADASYHDASHADTSTTSADAGHDAAHDAVRDTGPSAVDAHPDAGSDTGSDSGTPADAGMDASAHGCSYAGKARGTVDDFVTGEGTIADFDVDCAGAAFTTTAGGVGTCGITGCAGTATAITPAATYTTPSLRIGTSGLFVVASGVAVGDGGTPPLELYAQSRTSAASHLLLTQSTTNPSTPTEGPCRLASFGASGPFGFFWTLCTVGGLPTERVNAFDLVREATDGGASVLTGFPLPPGDDNFIGAAIAGGLLYEPGPTTSSSDSVVVYDLAGTPDAGSTFATLTGGAGPFKGAERVYATDTLVAFTAIDAGGFLFVCAAGAPCTAPVKVTFPAAWGDTPSVVAVFHDTLFLEDASNNLAECHAPDLLAGACTPTFLTAQPAAGGRIVADVDNVFYLEPDGSKIVRIAR